MLRLGYREIAERIVTARSARERATARKLVDAYYAIEPVPDNVGERFVMLRDALLRSVDES